MDSRELARAIEEARAAAAGQESQAFTPPAAGEPATPGATEPPGVMSDIGQSLMGAPRTAAESLMGMGGGLFDMQTAIAGKVMKKLMGWSDAEVAAKLAEWNEQRWFDNPQEISQKVTGVAEDLGVPPDIEAASRYQPQTGPGQVAQTAAMLAPGLASGGGSLPANLATRVGIPTAMIEGGGQVGKVLGDEQFGRMIGGLGSMGVPAATNRVTRPFPAQPGRADLARTLDQHEVPISAGQRTGNRELLYREDIAGGIPAIDDQGPAFGRAAGRVQGGFPDDATGVLSRDVMGTELTRMGDEFRRLASISEAPMTMPLLQRLTDVVDRYRENPLVGGRVERIVNDLFDNSQRNGSRITGEGYADTNSKIGDIIRNTADDAERGAMIELKNALDDIVEQNLPPAEQGAWRTVRQQYRDYLPIEKAKVQSSPTASRGVITPSGLKTGVKSIEGEREIASGNRPMTALAEAGQGIIEKPPQSGTNPRSRADLSNLLTKVFTSAGTTGGGAAMAGAPPGVAALLGIGAGALTGMSEPMRNAYIRSRLGQFLAARQGPAFPAGSAPGLETILPAIGEGPR